MIPLLLLSLLLAWLLASAALWAIDSIRRNLKP